MKNPLRLAIEILVLLVLTIVIVTERWSAASTWPGWNILSAVSTALAGVGLVFLAYQFAVQKSDFDVTRIEFLLGLSGRFDEAQAKWQQSIVTLAQKNYGGKDCKIPNPLPEREWHVIVESLTKCRESVAFACKIAKLAHSGIADMNLLYTLYFDELCEHTDMKLMLLYEFCGTGIELSSGYTHMTLRRMATALIPFYQALYAIDKRHGGTGYMYQVEKMQKLIGWIDENRERFDVTSDRYDKALEIKVSR